LASVFELVTDLFDIVLANFLFFFVVVVDFLLMNSIVASSLTDTDLLLSAFRLAFGSNKISNKKILLK
jgi:hypothetical protein